MDEVKKYKIVCLPAGSKESYTAQKRIFTGDDIDIVMVGQLVLEAGTNRLSQNGSSCWSATNDIDVLAPHHLHVISDEPIEEGDFWVYINPKEWSIKQDGTVTRNNLPREWFDKLWDIANYKKVVASTDPTITANSEMATGTIRGLLPWIPNKFKSMYAIEWNKGTKIEEVELDVVLRSTVPFSESAPDRDRGYEKTIKVNDDGTVNIRPAGSKQE